MAAKNSAELSPCSVPSEGPAVDAVADEIVEGVLRTSRALVAVAARSLAGVADDVTLGQYRLLVVLAARGPQRMVDLADALAMLPSTATRMCDRLVGKGLISRARPSDDRRAVVLTLAPAGRRLIEDVTRRRREEIREILTRVPHESHAGLIRSFLAFADAAGEIGDQEWLWQIAE
jgi:DNA-binding MarR family transcriptional regulator